MGKKSNKISTSWIRVEITIYLLVGKCQELD